MLDRDHRRAEVHDELLDVGEELVARLLGGDLDAELAVRLGFEPMLPEELDEPVAVGNAGCVDVDGHLGSNIWPEPGMGKHNVRFLDPALFRRIRSNGGGRGEALQPLRAVAASTHPVVRGGYAARLASLILGLFLFALGVVFILESKLGLSPWDVLNQGIAKHSPLSFGMANVVVGVVVLFIGWWLGGRPGLGTVANALGVGSFIQGLTSIDALTDLAHQPLGVRIALLVGGVALIGPATAFYIGADFGAGPRDTLMLVGARRTHARLAVVRATLELSALATGIVLGGTFGAGTVLFALGVGPCVEASFWALQRSPLAKIGSPTEAVAYDASVAS